MQIAMPYALLFDTRKHAVAALCAVLGFTALASAVAAPKVVLISLDGATPRLVHRAHHFEAARCGTPPRGAGPRDQSVSVGR